MAEIEGHVPVVLAAVDVSDDYRLEVTVRDPRTLAEASTLLDWSQAERLIEALRWSLRDAQAALEADFEVPAPLGFDLAEVVHASPSGDAWATPCCGRSPFELPRSARISADGSEVTCRGWSAKGEAAAS